jgi:hypothetical protein
MNEHSIETKGTAEIVVPEEARQIQQAILDYHHFYNLREEKRSYKDCLTAVETLKLLQIAFDELRELEESLGDNHAELIIASCDDPDDPLIIFRKSENVHSPRKVRELRRNETFCGYFFMGHDQFGSILRVISSETNRDNEFDPEFAILCVGTKGPEFKIVGLSFKHPSDTMSTSASIGNTNI